MRLRLEVPVVCLLLLSIAAAARAQEGSWRMAASGVIVQYDLSGTGNAPGVAFGVARDLPANLAVQVRALYARPEQQFGPSTLFVPEAQIQRRWHLARVSPFVGAGLGVATQTSPLRTEWDPTVSVGGGAGVSLTDRHELIGELRLRGIEWRFTGSTAEWSLGLAWKLFH